MGEIPAGYTEIIFHYEDEEPLKHAAWGGHGVSVHGGFLVPARATWSEFSVEPALSRRLN